MPDGQIGRLADLYGRKRAFLIGTLCQIAFSIGCGFAQGEIACCSYSRFLLFTSITDDLSLAVLRGF